MSSPVMHWGMRAWRRNLDELVTDPDRPQAFPAENPVDMMGRIRVRLCAEDGCLVGYGFGRQRIALHASAVGAVQTVDAYRTGRVNHGRALLVLDHERRILLRARGLWETYGEVAQVCRAAGVAAPEHVPCSAWGRSRASGRSRSGSQAQQPQTGRHARQRPLLYAKAPGCRKLRIVPRSAALYLVALLALFVLTTSGTVCLGVLPAVLLPGWAGSVRVLLGIAGVALGLAAGTWLCAALAHLFADAVRWANASLTVGSPAPFGRFFRRRDRADGWQKLATAGMLALVPAMIAWGPGVGIASLAHGLSDSHLIAELRARGVTTPGFLIDVPQYSTDSSGETHVTDVPMLSFAAGRGNGPWNVTDPPIGGRPLALNQADPADTVEPVTVVYLPGNPDTAAAERQITGSVWHGAPTGNLVVGSLFTLLLPLLIWRLRLRLRRRRWRRDGGLLDDIADVGA